MLTKLLPHKSALFTHLTQRWRDLFGARFEVLRYNLRSTYFEAAPPENVHDKRRYGYSRDKRPDCVQVVIALIVTPEGFPLAYEVLPGNTSDTFKPASSHDFQNGPDTRQSLHEDCGGNSSRLRLSTSCAISLASATPGSVTSMYSTVRSACVSVLMGRWC